VRPSSTSRFLALSIVAAGIFTFFWPLVTVDPPVAGTTRWSAFSIVFQMYNGVLPSPICERCGEPSVRALLALPLDFAAAYVLMAFMAIALSLRVPARVVMWFPLIWISVVIRWRVGTRIEFEKTFFGISQHGSVHYGGLLTAHLVVMGALFLACLDLRDEESSEETRPSIRHPVQSQEPPIIDAEIVSENEKAHETTHEPPRLHD